MKKLILTSLILSFCIMNGTSLFAQNLKKESVKVNYIQLPGNPLPSDITTYSRNIKLPSSLNAGESRSAISSTLEKNARIAGYKLVEEGAPVELFVEIQNFYNRSFESRTIEKEEKRGEEKVKVNYYVYDLQYKYPLYFSLKVNGEKIQDGYINNSNDYKLATSPEFKNSNDRYEWYKKNKTSFISSLRSSALNTNSGAYGKSLTDNYAFQSKSKLVSVLNIKTTKKKNYDDVNAIGLEMQTALESILPKKGSAGADFNEKSGPVIEKYIALLEQVDWKNKKARLNKKAGAYLAGNIAILSFWANDFDKCREYLRLADKYSNKSFISEYKSLINAREGRLAKYKASISN
ncbi:hypothetical protein EI427_12885 [Flammeovirga pectinis]|uniref:Tetratricopeptide repeat protein n=1 Tax=Flammeovirga pectinis TaxID=2494373 RepID=A0A3Q9FPQ6_9BACT|nr:hypothetical protein [Flammeovirga pectinis]AZQ63100.1 hypothetical protein EI427_12885 [Flammeovirga pectinis]